MEIIYETSRLILYTLDDSHLDAAKEFWGDEEVMALCDGASSHDVLPRIINAYGKCQETHDLSVFAVEDKESNEIIGAAGFNITGSVSHVELIYHFSKKSWGKGFATEAASACIEIARNHGKVQVITASASPENRGSLKVLEKVGFTFIGMKWFEDTQQEEPCYEYRI
ncbi:GNAT family N-acetyltransferase [Sporosarcina beigongshangi]|uniref:GNAT family N-acetyltransferase n=1 Tax=Sporosarcina beigongshangi TaxID=2782538 RepID=UPI001939B5DE|nr:GNAT family N-acetyltransferase [Sporosarcina beigongshangi]